MTTTYNITTNKNGQQTRSSAVIRFKRNKWTINNFEKKQSGYAIIPRPFLDYGKFLSNNAFRVAVGLYRHANEDTGKCDIGNKALAAELGIDPSGIKRGLNELEHFKWIDREAQQYNLKSGNFKTRQKNLTYPVIEVLSSDYDLEDNAGRKYKVVMSPATKREAKEYAMRCDEF